MLPAWVRVQFSGHDGNLCVLSSAHEALWCYINLCIIIIIIYYGEAGLHPSLARRSGVN